MTKIVIRASSGGAFPARAHFRVSTKRLTPRSFLPEKRYSAGKDALSLSTAKTTSLSVQTPSVWVKYAQN